MVNVKKVRNFGAHSPILDVFIKSSPQGTGNYVEEDVERGEEQEVVDDSQRAASSRPIGSMCYKLTETDSKHKIHSCLN